MAMFGLQGVDHIPDNALVYVDSSHNYYSPPLVWEDDRSFYLGIPSLRGTYDSLANCKVIWMHNKDKKSVPYRPTDGVCVIPVSKGTIKGKKYSPDQKHVNAGGFYGKSGPLLFHLLGWNKSRWAPDGEWRW
jgi:hypothetical protein